MVSFNIIIEKDEDGYYISEVVGLPGCHTQSKSIDNLIDRTREAIVLYLESVNSEIEVKSEFIGVQKIEV